MAGEVVHKDEPREALDFTELLDLKGVSEGGVGEFLRHPWGDDELIELSEMRRGRNGVTAENRRASENSSSRTTVAGFIQRRCRQQVAGRATTDPDLLANDQQRNGGER